MSDPASPILAWCNVDGHWLLPNGEGEIQRLAPIEPLNTDGTPRGYALRCSAKIAVPGRGTLSLVWLVHNGDLQQTMATFAAVVAQHAREAVAPKIIVPGRG